MSSSISPNKVLGINSQISVEITIDVLELFPIFPDDTSLIETSITSSSSLSSSSAIALIVVVAETSPEVIVNELDSIV